MLFRSVQTEETEEPRTEAIAKTSGAELSSSCVTAEYSSSMANLSSELPNVAATVTVYDQSDGLYGELIDAPSAVASTSSEHHAAATLEGSDLTNSVPKLCSVEYGYADNRDGHQRTGVEFFNYCSSFVRIRWVDANGIARPSHIWTLAPGQDMFQSTTPGHVFLVSAVMQRGEDDLFGSNAHSHC